jgi:hypothetical protein
MPEANDKLRAGEIAGTMQGTDKETAIDNPDIKVQ